ncbi:phosphoglycerate mutase [Haematobacter missouriensis]|uniref:Histidine phosphatase family protein n=1 Tax=Haematobacter missouriensis TaxID=366616 RepID=A0A212AYU2_9RHOB|nr:histidine phosphatase family protein [Haematobacter missouriensis]KFI25528.1 phosphoglycerate mutase [Haematobacter missouriensis]OWJ75524.1 histidine phosphatase family protein [Haematobacter missouriensis]OWJ86631.1 histidine phosphatase family protein [Haematobacter missouriensis]
MTELLILRHGETFWNRERRMQGWQDSALTPAGEAQARAICRLLQANQVDWRGWRFLSSPLGRALKTADIALGALGAVELEPDLREIGMGAWEGLTIDEIALRWPASATVSDPLAWYAAAPGGEPLAHLRARAEAVLARLEGPAVLVTHGFFSRYLRGAALGLAEAELSALEDRQGVVWRIREGRMETLDACPMPADAPASSGDGSRTIGPYAP